MPLYTYRCPEGHMVDKVVKLKNFDVPQPCPEHMWMMEKVVVAPMVIGDYQGYNCPVTGKWIEGRRAHEENLKRTGSRVLEAGEQEANARRKAQDNEAFDEKISRTIDEEIDKLPTRVKEKLGEEIASGVDIKVTRI